MFTSWQLITTPVKNEKTVCNISIVFLGCAQRNDKENPNNKSLKPINKNSPFYGGAITMEHPTNPR